MSDYSKFLRKKLFSIISQMAKSKEDFVANPGVDFSRERKFDFSTIIKFLLTIDGGSIDKELLNFFDFNESLPTSSAFVQQRKKLLPSSFLYLLKKFLPSNNEMKTFRNYRLLATDGTKFLIPQNPNDLDSYKKDRDCVRGYNLLAIDALYDLVNNLYLDARVSGTMSHNEKKSLIDMVGKSKLDNSTILIVDRGYEAYGPLCTLQEKGWKFLFRVKDMAKNGILPPYKAPSDGEFDFWDQRDLTYSNSKKMKSILPYYHLASAESNIEILNQEGISYYSLRLRFVRVKISDDRYELLVTNLDQDEFSKQDLKELYNIRWGIETSFCDLKYTVGLLNFHSKGRHCIEQEIFSKLIMYNYSSMVTNRVIIKQKNRKYMYQVTFARAVQICKEYLRRFGKARQPKVEVLLKRYISPIRNNRSFPRDHRKKVPINFIYRIS